MLMPLVYLRTPYITNARDVGHGIWNITSRKSWTNYTICIIDVDSARRIVERQ
jgi:hypothetical protein